MKKSEKPESGAVLKISEHKRKREDAFQDDIDALFRLPLAEFTGARNVLAAQLKKSGRGDDAALVKALPKPPISAWAANQLYWNHREAFDRLIVSGEKFHKAQTSGKVADMRHALDARREALTQLSDLATSLLEAANNNAAPDTIRRITTTLEGLSAYASRSDAPRAGRLTHDVDPPGFELFGSSTPGAGGSGMTGRPARVTPSSKSISAATSTQRKAKPDTDLRQVEEARKAKTVAAKVSLQDAKRALTQSRARTLGLEAAQKKADAEAKKAEKLRRDAEQNFEKAKAASEDAARRARNAALEIEEALRAVDDAERAVGKAAKELESLS